MKTQIHHFVEEYVKFLSCLEMVILQSFFLEAIKSAARGWRCIWPANGSAVVYCCSKKQQEGNDILYVLFSMSEQP